MLDDISLFFRIRSGAKLCKPCRPRQELSNEYLLQVLQKSVAVQPRTGLPKFLIIKNNLGEEVLNGSVRGHVRTNEELLYHPPPFRLFHSAPPRIEALQKSLKFRYLPNFVLKIEFNIWPSFRNYKC